MMRSLLTLVLTFLTCSAACAQEQPAFTTSISFGITVSVHVWDGKTSAYDFTCNALKKDEHQGALVILGRDAESIWYVQAGYSNDAAEESYFMNLACINVKDSCKVFPTKVNQKDTTFEMRFHTAFFSTFKKKKINNLIPVQVWSPPQPNYDYVARVNCAELNRCFDWNFLVDSENNGSCVFYFEWTSQSMPYQQKRTVGFANCQLTIPASWTYFMGEKSGYVAQGGDTLFCTESTLMHFLPYEMIEYSYIGQPSQEIIELNRQVSNYNDSLRKANPLLLTHEQKSFYQGDTTVYTIMPRTDTAGCMMMWVSADGERFSLTTTALTPEEQIIFREVMNSWEMIGFR